MQVIALRPGDLAVSNGYSLRYVGKLAEGHGFELAFSDRAAFSVVTGKSVSVTTVWAHVPELFAMDKTSQLRIGLDQISISELSGGKVAVNYFGDGPFNAVYGSESGSLIGQR